MTDFTILIDNREQKPYSFEEYPVETEEVTLETSDYVLKGDGFWNNNDTFIPYFGTERKSQDDFLNSITWERDRFRKEIRRADGWDNPLPIMVESPWRVFQNENYYRDVNRNAIEGTVNQWANNYNCEFFFKNDRADAERATYEFLRWRHESE
jgi:ERCC4-type nuclease